MICAVLASGPSMTKAAADKVRGRVDKTIVVNDTWRLAPWADVLYACDGKWWDVHEGVPGFKGEKWTQDKKAAERWGLNYIPGVNEPGLSPPGAAVIHNGANSAYQAMGLAILWGARKILLLGVDLRPVAGRMHWFGDHPKELGNPTPTAFAKWIDHFNRAAELVPAMGVEVVNCSPVSALDAFPKKTLEDVL